MNQRSLRALVALNVVLLVGLVLMVATPANEAQAQLGAGSDYVMVAGQVVGRTQQAGVYIINLRNGQVVAVFVNSDTKQVEKLATYDMSGDLGANQRR